LSGAVAATTAALLLCWLVAGRLSVPNERGQ
jgi:hypothetical protein